MANKITVNLDTSKNQYNIYDCKQNDDLILEAKIYESGKEKDVSAAEIIVNCTRSDGTYVIQNTEITKEKNKIIANLKRDFTRVAGLDRLELVLIENEKQNTTFDFNILVKPSVLKTAVEESKDTVIILEELGNKIVEAGQVKAETENLIATGGAATKGDIAKVNSHLEQKANKEEINALGKLQFSGQYDTLEQLKVAKPTGAEGIFLVVEDGYIYRWSGSDWIQSTKFQSDGIAKNSVTNDNLNIKFFNSFKNNEFEKNEIFEENIINYNGYLGLNSSISPTILNLKLSKNGEVYTNKATNTSNTDISAIRTETLATYENVYISFDFEVKNNSNFACYIGFTDINGNVINKRQEFGFGSSSKKVLFLNDSELTFIKSLEDGIYNFRIEIINNEFICYINKEEVYRTSYNITYKNLKIRINNGITGQDTVNTMYLANLQFGNIYSIEVPKVEILKTYNNYGSLNGKHTHIYNFGGKGNDWCFVRTPQNYNPQREKPYPFVICNHGNGWTMNGTLEKANWTKRTMYVKATDSDYIANPSQYNVVDDNSPLLYSNPTIEKLLEAGYIVCGSQNFADNLYGNNNCRNACADFFYHMVKNYNVEDRCHMIGASNGAMTTLNAVYLLGEKVKSIILQYPLTCLWKHYSNYPLHQSAIESAFGISNGLTEEEFKKATRTHDVMTINVINNQKIGYFPPTKIWYSLGDTTTKAVYNSIPFLELLENSNLINESIVATGNHGDYTHFNPTEYLAWFEKYN